jgi:hypothetical protein
LGAAPMPHISRASGYFPVSDGVVRPRLGVELASTYVPRSRAVVSGIHAVEAMSE